MGCRSCYHCSRLAMAGLDARTRASERVQTGRGCTRLGSMTSVPKLERDTQSGAVVWPRHRSPDVGSFGRGAWRGTQCVMLMALSQGYPF